ncbi:MAG: glycerate kinase [Nitrospirae bacterium YQR-1]
MNIERQRLEYIFKSAVKAVMPHEAVTAKLDYLRHIYKESGCNRVIVTGFGKAACQMAQALEGGLEGIIQTGAVVTKYGHSVDVQLKKISVFEASHPIPDENAVAAADKIIEICKGADAQTLHVCLISGGGSALLTKPSTGITIDEKKELTRLLLKSGADIAELNTVRKHISAIKGGRLSGLVYPAITRSLIISDVIADRVDTIASGPTAPDNSTFSDAYIVLKKYRLLEKTPGSIIETIEKGMRGEVPETPKSGDKIFNRTKNIIVSNNTIALNAAKKAAQKIGYETEILSCTLSGEAKEAARKLAAVARSKRAQRGLLLLSAGETTVTVNGTGCGGRNTEFALAFARHIEGVNGITLLSAGTDGIDGETDAAGAVVNSSTIAKAMIMRLDPQQYLDNNDSYNFFRQTGELFITGPTGTNVMDIQLIAIE